MRFLSVPSISPVKRTVPALLGATALLTLGGAVSATSLANASSLATRATRATRTTRLVRIGTAPVLPVGTQPLAAASGTQKLRVTVALKPRHAAALSAYAAAVSDPQSPDYRQYLSTAEFAARFGASSQTIDAVRTALKRQGLTAGPLAANHLSFDVVASSASFERAMNLTLAHVELPDHRAALIDIEAPAVPASVASDVQAIVGLDGLQTMRSMRSSATTSATAKSSTSTKATGAKASTAKTTRSTTATAHAVARQPTACAAASSAATSESGYTDPEIASAYNFTPLYDAGDEGAGVTVGIYELEPNLTSDIATYQSCYGTDTSVTYQSVDGGSGSGAGSGEAAFDIEQLIGFAPKANLIVYQAPNSDSDNPGSGPYDLFADIISQDKVQVVSNSWGECEAVEGASDAHAENTLFEEAAVQGMTVLSAAGDDGSEDCDGQGAGGSSALAVDDPGSQPYVTDVGGTALTAIGSPNTEVVWNGGGNALSGLSSGAGAGGGGISGLWDMPSYQSSAPASLNVLNSYSSGAKCGNSSGDCREVPDVSADADPSHGYIIYYNGNSSVSGPAGWQASGGTSGAAPLWAALFADADADRACDSQPIGFANPTLYAIAAAAQDTYFHDITSGDNDFTGANHGLYPAGPGYDLATGLGTPNAAGLAGVLCADSLRLIAPRSTAAFVGQSVRLAVKTSAAAGTSVTVAVTGLPAGISYNRTTKVISGTAKSPGVHVVKLTASDAAGTVRTASFVLDIARKPTISRIKLSGVAAAKPALSLRLTAGRDETGFTAISLVLPAGLSLHRGSGVNLRSTAGAHLARAVSGGGRKVTIKLAVATTGVVVQFPAGALSASSQLSRAAGARSRPRLNVAAVTRDAAGLLASLKGSFTPVN